MSDGLATTLAVLAKTRNEAAMAVLVPALDAPAPALREAALSAILKRRDPTGMQLVLRRLPQWDSQWKAIVDRNGGCLARTMRDAVLGADDDLCRLACQAAVTLREYDLLPVLLSAVEDRSGERAELAGATLRTLIAQLCDEFTGRGHGERRRDPHALQRYALSVLEPSLGRFAKHRRVEVLEAVLLLTNRENPSIISILHDSHHAAYGPLMELLRESEHPAILRLLLSFLDDPRMPTALLGVLGKRQDLPFLRQLLRKVGHEPAPAAAQNLRRLETIGWLHLGWPLFSQFDEAAQHGLVRLAMHAGVPRVQAFAVVAAVLTQGNVAGRREAARALAEFTGADANALALRALADPDPQVQAAVVTQLRRRGIAGALPRLIALLDDRQALVRNAARQSLGEFTFARLLGAFDMLDDEARRSTAELVRKIDPHAIAQLKRELQANGRLRRLRGLEIARWMGAMEQVEAEVIAMLYDEDHLVRAQAVAALNPLNTASSQAALVSVARDDPHAAVQAAIRQGQEQTDRLEGWRAVADPRD